MKILAMGGREYADARFVNAVLGRFATGFAKNY